MRHSVLDCIHDGSSFSQGEENALRVQHVLILGERASLALVRVSCVEHDVLSSTDQQTVLRNFLSCCGSVDSQPSVSPSQGSSLENHEEL